MQENGSTVWKFVGAGKYENDSDQIPNAENYMPDRYVADFEEVQLIVTQDRAYYVIDARFLYYDENQDIVLDPKIEEKAQMVKSLMDDRVLIEIIQDRLLNTAKN